MAKFDFPTSPVLNQIYALNGVSYKWNGYGWVTISGPDDTLPTITTWAMTLLDDGTATEARATLGLDQIDNTSDANKPVSSAQATALSGKLSLTGGTVSGGVTFGAAIVVAQRSTFTLGLIATQTAAQYAIQGSPGALGGVIGFGSSSSIYGISGYGGYAFYGSGDINTGGGLLGTGNVDVNGYLIGNTTGSDVLTSSSNTVCSTGGALRRTTSSGAHKTKVEPLDFKWAEKVLDLKTVYYHPLNTADPKGYTRYGFIAEQCHSIDPRFSHCEDKTLVGFKRIKRMVNGRARIDKGAPIYKDKINIVGIDLNAVVAALLVVVRRQDERIRALEASNA